MWISTSTCPVLVWIYVSVHAVPLIVQYVCTHSVSVTVCVRSLARECVCARARVRVCVCVCIWCVTQ